HFAGAGVEGPGDPRAPLGDPDRRHGAAGRTRRARSRIWIPAEPARLADRCAAFPVFPGCRNSAGAVAWRRAFSSYRGTVEGGRIVSGFSLGAFAIRRVPGARRLVALGQAADP